MNIFKIKIKNFMEKLFRSAIIFRIISAFCFIGACIFLLLGIYRFILGFIYFYKSIVGREWLNPGIYIIVGLDTFMLALLFVIFAYGIYRIFILHDIDDSKFPAWLHVHSFSELKLLLWETSLVTLIVFSVTLITQEEHPVWNELIVPTAILMLSAAYFFTKKGKDY